MTMVQKVLNWSVADDYFAWLRIQGSTPPCPNEEELLSLYQAKSQEVSIDEMGAGLKSVNDHIYRCAKCCGTVYGRIAADRNELYEIEAAVVTDSKQDPGTLMRLVRDKSQHLWIRDLAISYLNRLHKSPEVSRFFIDLCRDESMEELFRRVAADYL